MRGFDNKFLDELKAKSDIVDVVSRYVPLEQRGPNFWGRCPFHHEKTPSFCVNSVDQFYYCFGCHKAGDVISFVQEIESIDFHDAVKFLADKVGMEMPAVSVSDEKIKEQMSHKKRILSLLKDAARFYAKNLRTGSASNHIDYIYKRGISEDTLNKFGIGASLDYHGLVNELKNKGYTYKEMVDSGAVGVKNTNYYDALAGRLIIPVIDQLGNVIAFCGRIIDNRKDVGKYVNTRETLVFTKGKTLFNLNNLKKLKNEVGIKNVIIVEGHMDVISLVEAGFENVVASMGTALTKDQARIIKRFTNDVYISYDGDFAGQKAAIRGLEILRDEGLDVKVISLPDGMDPDDVIKKQGKEAYSKLIDDAKLLIDFKLDILRRTFDVSKVDEKRKYIKEALKVISSSDSESEKEELLKMVRDLTGITYESLKRELVGVDTGVKKEHTVIKEEIIGDKILQAERFVLYSYLFNKDYTAKTDISSIEFPSAVGVVIQKYIMEEKAKGEAIKPNLVFDYAPEEIIDDVKEILKLEMTEQAGLDKERFFRDCVNSLVKSAIDKKIEKLTKIYKTETETAKRKSIAEDISKLTIKKRGLQ